MKIKILTYNINNNKKALKDIFTYINTLTHYTIFISLQECFISFGLPNFKYVYHKKMYGIHSLILSNVKLNVKFYCYCLGSFYLGNKGYVLCTINNLVFGCVHLIHGDDKKIEREKQIGKIIKNLTKENVILAGDFNFRRQLNKDENDNSLFKKKENNIENFKPEHFNKTTNRDLTDNYDKLIVKNYPQYEDIKIMTHFDEQKIVFPVTYKYKKNILDKSRIPSYCDRIIYKLDLPYKIIEYNSLHTFENSDHKPVFLDIEIDYIKGSSKLKTDIFSEISTLLFENWFFVGLFTLLMGYFFKKLIF